MGGIVRGHGPPTALQPSVGCRRDGNGTQELPDFHARNPPVESFLFVSASGRIAVYAQFYRGSFLLRIPDLRPATPKVPKTAVILHIPLVTQWRKPVVPELGESSNATVLSEDGHFLFADPHHETQEQSHDPSRASARPGRKRQTVPVGAGQFLRLPNGGQQAGLC